MFLITKIPLYFLFNSCAKLLSAHVLDLFLMNIRANLDLLDIFENTHSISEYRNSQTQI